MTSESTAVGGGAGDLRRGRGAVLLRGRRSSGHRPGHAAHCLLAPGRTVIAALGAVTLTVGGIAGCAAVTGPGHHRSADRSAGAAAASLQWERAATSAVGVPAGTSVLQIAAGIDEGWFLGEPGARGGALPSAGILGVALSRGTSRLTSPADITAASSLAGSGIPSTALASYQLAARREATRRPSCGITWPLLAGIGRVESNHGRFAGAVLHTDGVSTPRIIGIPLNGVGTARIMDTDGGRIDGDPVFDRAVGPMQFIPSTWAGFGVDANHDGRKDPFNVYDAAAAAADYLCAAGRNLRTYPGQVQAVRSYNNSDSYIAMVLQLERVYAAGVGSIRVPVVPTSPDPRHVRPVHPVKLPPVDPGSPRGLPKPPKGEHLGVGITVGITVLGVAVHLSHPLERSRVGFRRSLGDRRPVLSRWWVEFDLTGPGGHERDTAAGRRLGVPIDGSATATETPAGTEPVPVPDPFG